jgi:orotidine-5'-phosphate decarboxylase
VAKIDGLKFHDLRHTCASDLAQEGASFLEITGVLGRKTLATVMRYAHLMQKRKATVVQRMLTHRGLGALVCAMSVRGAATSECALPGDVEREEPPCTSIRVLLP